jgi:hypothetical protein
MREDNIAVLLTKRLSIEWGKMGWERTFAGIEWFRSNGVRR